MAFVPVANGVEVFTQFLGYDRPFYVRQYVLGSNPVTSEDFEDIAATLEDVYTETWSDYASNEVSIGGWGMRDAADQDGLVTFIPPSTPIVGTVTTTIPEANVAGVLSWRTGFAGRGRRGRNYFPGWGFISPDGQTWNSAQLGGMQLFADALILALQTAGFPLVIASKVVAGAPRVAAQVTLVTSCIPNPRLGTVRLRI